jgi:hydrogenase maturation protease
LNLKLQTLVIGVGNPDRGDDGAGVEVVRRLSGRLPPGVRAVELGGDMSRLLSLFPAARCAIIVDAMRSGEPTGTIARFNARETPLPVGAFCGTSSHAFDVASAIELGRSLGTLPERIVVVGIEGERVGLGSTRSAAVDAAIDRIVADLGNELISSPARRSVRSHLGRR